MINSIVWEPVDLSSGSSTSKAKRAADKQSKTKDKDIIPPVSDNLFSLSEDEIKERNINCLPETLHEAIEEFKSSEILKETLGEHIFYKYIEAKEKEWKEYHTTVSEFELAKYLER